MRAITIKQPWAALIMGDVHVVPPKRLENRGRPPPPALRGRRVAIHAGMGMDRKARSAVASITGAVGTYHHGAFLGTARVVGFVEVGRNCGGSIVRVRATYYGEPPAWMPTMETLEAVPERWYLTGPFGWILDDVRRLSAPLPCKGALGPWRVPAELVPMLEVDDVASKC